MNARWRIQLFGGLRAVRGERVVTHFPTQKAAVLLAYFAYHAERTHPRDILLAMLWPDVEPEAGRHRLSVTLSSLRRLLELPDAEALFVADRFTVRLQPGAVTTDVAEFEAALQTASTAKTAEERARSLQAAVALYEGELLTGYYEDWILSEQPRWALRVREAHRELIGYCEQIGDFVQGIEFAHRALQADPLSEETHRCLMRLCVAAGQPAAAVRQYRELERLLQRELGEKPDAATRELAEAIRQDNTAGRGRGSTRERERPAADPPSILSLSPSLPLSLTVPIEPPGGAVPLHSPLYVARVADGQFRAAITRRDSIVLVKGAREVGKTSLLARGAAEARQSGARVVLTDLEKLNAVELATADALLLALAQRIADELDLEMTPADHWSPRRGPNANFERFVERTVLGSVAGAIVWVLDEVDQLFSCAYGSEIFGLFRSWHNERALDPSSPWSRFTLAMAYATEARLFITDLNKSPFNVGTRLTLEDFTLEQVDDLNRRHGSPLSDEEDLTRFYRLLGGHPSLVRRGLYEMATSGGGIATLESHADQDEGVFGDHLRRMLAALSRDTDLCDAVRTVLDGRPCPSAESFFRLRTAGVLAGDSAQDARPRCQLYAEYLKKRFELRAF